MSWAVVFAIALILSLGYRLVRYAMIRRAGYEVRWSSPIARWWRRIRQR